MSTREERKSVRLRVTFEIEQTVPADWDKDMITFFYNDSSSCASNLLTAKLKENDGCCCMSTSAEVIDVDP